MRNRIKTASTLVYKGGNKMVAKKSTTESMITKYYELSEETEPHLKLKDAWAMYRAFKLRTEFGKIERGLK